MTATASHVVEQTDAPVVVNLAPNADLSPALDAIEKAYARLRRTYADVPPATIVVKRDARAWGHTTVAHVFGTSDSESPDRLEIMISAENLARGARYVAATLIHEAAHAANLAAGVLDTDMNGRHSRKFADKAEAMGLTVANGGWRGWTDTTLDDDGAHTHRVMVRMIERGLAKAAKAHAPKPMTVVPTGEGATATGVSVGGGVVIVPPRKRGNRNLLKAVCPCGYSMRASAGMLAESKPKCGKCRKPFEAV